MFDNIKQFQKTIVEIESKHIEIELETQLTNKLKEENEKLTKQKEYLVNSKLIQRNIEDNIQLRTKSKHIENITQEISALHVQISTNFANVRTDKEQLQSEYDMRVEEKSTLKGQAKQLGLQIKDIQRILDGDKYKQAHNVYKKKLLEIKVNEQIMYDMKIFIEGLENLIIQIHNDKMKSVNDYIKEYWRSIYRGNDIDYIQIRSNPTESDSSNRRVYDYKVVQIRDEAEIEMRDCCSAGQKVLACLIIRMALSSVFSHECGILALDEPTTNLDRENIISLSETLGGMVQDRRDRDERNFQLLVITHDEEFVRALSRYGDINTCLRVKRDRNGKSVVKQEVIN